jgi:acetyl esterase/lipase
MIRSTIFAACLTFTTALGAQQPAEIPLWRAGAPGSEGKSAPEKVRITSEGDHVVSSVHRPTITPYLPDKRGATGTAIVVVPGGAHRELWMDHEGYNVARYLRDHGIAAFILKYRLARDSGSTYTIEGQSVPDLQRAIRLVRSNAAAWGVDTARIGVMGFSAGGEVAGRAAAGWDDGIATAADPIDRQSSRPAFQALIYPAWLDSLAVTKRSPPLFIAAGNDDKLTPPRGMTALYLKHKDAGVPAELHIYASAQHGFGIRPTNHSPSAGWPDRLVEWLTDMKMLPAK